MRHGFKTLGIASAMLGALLSLASPAGAHTKGISLSRYGLVDVSWTANVVYSEYTEYEDGYNPTKWGDRQLDGLTLTSFDLAFSQDFYQWPAKWALFTAWGADEVAIEEAFILFHKLPANLQFRTGIYRVQFGKLNQYHDHEWVFADAPLSNTFFLGGDGVHNLGAELSYQPPTPFYTELVVSLMRGPIGTFDRTYPAGDTDPVGGSPDGNQLVFFARGVTYVDLSDDTNLELGLSYADGRNKTTDVDYSTLNNPDNVTPHPIGDRTTLTGFDFTYTYKPGSFDPYFRWTTEFIWAQRDNPVVVGLDRDARQTSTALEDQVTYTLRDSDRVGGMYTEANYRFAYEWDVGARYDLVGIPKGHEDKQERYTVCLRYFINPVSRFNFQYSHVAESGDDKAFDAFYIQMNVGGGTVTPGTGKFYNLF